MFRTILCSLITLCLCAGCNSNTEKRANADVSRAPEVKNTKVIEAKTPVNKTKTDVSGAKAADQVFVQTADQISMTEVKLGNVAEKNAKSDAVKKFGARMVSDHSIMNEGLRAIASKNSFAIATALDSKHQELLQDLSKLKGADFDRTYTKDMAAGHEKAIATFEAEAKNGQNSDVKAWAEKWLPTLHEHLTMAQAAVQDVKKE